MRGNVVTVKEFDGVYTDYSGQVPENGFQRLTNMEVTNKGTLACRRGLAYRGTYVVDPGVGIIGRHRTVLHNNLLVNSAAGIRVINVETGTWLGTKPTSSGNVVLQRSGNAYIFSSGSNVITYNGTTFTSTPVTVRGSLGVVHKNRMFVCENNGGTATSTLYYSKVFADAEPNLAASWPANQNIQVAGDDGDFITSVVVLNDTLIIFKKFSTWALYFDTNPVDGVVRQLHPTIGCIGKDTTVVIGGLLYFLSAQGVFRTDGTTFELISLPVSEWFESLTTYTAATCNRRSAIEYDGKYILQVDSATTALQVYNIEVGAWSEWVFPASFGKIVSFPDSTPTEWGTFYHTASRYAVYSKNTGVLDEDSATSFGSAIRTKHTNFDKPELYKSVKEIALDISMEYGVGVSPTISAYMNSWKDFSSVGTNYLSTVTNNFERKLLRFTGPGKCREVRLEFFITPANYFEINSISYDIRTRERVERAH